MKTYLRGIASRAMQNVVELGLLKEADETIVRDAQGYWEDPSVNGFQSNSHWRGQQGLSVETWSEIGKPHLRLFHNHMAWRRTNEPLRRIIEWGCGGGANAVHFAGETEEFVGVDVSRYTLMECGIRLSERGFLNFVPIQISIAQPEDFTRHLIGTCDVFLCTYVFELFPTPEYGQRILSHAFALLRPSGFALIQIKYQTHERRTRSRRWRYERNLANMTTYPIDVFWEIAEKTGFAPSSVSLRPKDGLVHDERYAYFLLDKPAQTTSHV